ncbi:MAG: hypothetical protein ISQ07_11210, partial [Pirellulales bacterium]|nr:hypothetical protein [Pirellulales bacterium]
MTTPARHTARRLALHALKAASLVMALATCLPQAAAQWTPGTEYNAVTLGSGSFFTTDDSYTQAVSSNAASVEVWVNFSASAQATMAIGQVFSAGFNEGIVLS